MSGSAKWFVLGLGVAMSLAAVSVGRSSGAAGSYQIACIGNPKNDGTSNCTVLDTRTGKIAWSHMVDYTREEPTDAEMKQALDDAAKRK